MKKNLFVFLLSVLGFFFSSHAFAEPCVCENLSDDIRYEQAGAVFTAKSISPTETANNALWDTFVVTTIEKADKDSQLLIDSFEINGEKRARIAQKISDCNFIFEEGKHYRVFTTVKLTQKGKPYFTTNVCSGTNEIEATKGTAQNEQTPASGNEPQETNEETKSADEQNATEK